MADIYVGTSGFDYPEWKPSFYPADLPRKQFLKYYSSRFRSVELNSTFYQIPNAARIAAWRSAVPADFRFVLKAPRRITHVERLKLPSEALKFFLQSAAGLGQGLGAVLFQLPPFFKRDEAKLAAFLDELPRELRAAFEFRHESWFAGETYALLEKHGAALCVNDSDDATTPVRLTARFAYLRLRRANYPEDRRREWQSRMRGWAEQGIDVYAFIKHEDNPDAPLQALAFGVGLR